MNDTQKAAVFNFIFDNMELLDWLGDSEDDYESLGKNAKKEADTFLERLERIINGTTPPKEVKK